MVPIYHTGIVVAYIMYWHSSTFELAGDCTTSTHTHTHIRMYIQMTVHTVYLCFQVAHLSQHFHVCQHSQVAHLIQHFHVGQPSQGGHENLDFLLVVGLKHQRLYAQVTKVCGYNKADALPLNIRPVLDDMQPTRPSISYVACKLGKEAGNDH